jgi:hypothetical protein
VHDKGVDEHCLDAYSLNICGEWYLFLSVKVSATIYVSKVTEIESNRICGIELIFPGEPSIIFLSVYLPAVTQSYEMFSREIEYRFDIYNAYSNNANVFILGDFNSGPQKLT